MRQFAFYSVVLVLPLVIMATALALATKQRPEAGSSTDRPAASPGSQA
jgi:hypothetical protein